MRRIVCLFFNGLMLCGPLPARALEPVVASAPLTQESRLASGADAKNIDYRPYMKTLQAAIKAAWYPPMMRGSADTRVAFKVDAKGIISHVVITKSSGSIRVDSAALTALKRAKLPPLPAAAPESVDIDFTFEYHAGKKRSG